MIVERLLNGCLTIVPRLLNYYSIRV